MTLEMPFWKISVLTVQTFPRRMLEKKYMFKSKKKKKNFLQEALDLQRGSTSWQGNSFPIITIHKPLEKLEPTSPQQRSSYFAEDSTHSEQAAVRAAEGQPRFLYKCRFLTQNQKKNHINSVLLLSRLWQGAEKTLKV